MDNVADFLEAGATGAPPAAHDDVANFLEQGSKSGFRPPQEGFQGNDAGAFAAGVNGFNSAVPFGNKITDAIGAGIAKVGGAEGSFSDLYLQANADTNATEKAHPIANAIGTGAGIATSLPIAKGAGEAITGALDGTKAAPAVNYLSRLGTSPEGAGRLQRLANVGIRSAKGAIMAAPAGALYGAGASEPGKELEGAQSGAKMAAVVGAGIPVIAAGASEAVDALAPKVDEGLKSVGQLAQKYGIPVSLDQISKSKVMKSVQKVSQELPFSGQEAFREKQISAFQKGLLDTVGIEGEKFTPQVMDEAFTKVGKEFDDLGKGKTFQLDDSFARSLDNIREEAKSISTQDAIANFENEVGKIFKDAGPDGSISGEKLGLIRSRINGLARKTNNPDTQGLLHDLENSVIDTMTSGDDAVSGAFSQTKQKYKNLLVLEPLAAKAKGGNISPSLLANRVGKIYGRSYTRGKAGEIGDLARIGSELLPELGGSDTVQKAIMTAAGKAAATIGSAGAGALQPVATAGALGANRAYQSLINRNQGLIGKVLSAAEIAKLPPKEAMEYLKNFSAAQAGSSYAKNKK